MKIPKRLRAKAREDYPLPELLEDINGSIKRVFGLNLSLIERANLKRTALQVYEDHDRLVKAINYDFSRMQVELFQVKAETTCRFMMNYYSLPRELANISCSRSPRLADVVIHSNYQGFEDYLKKFKTKNIILVTNKFPIKNYPNSIYF